MRIARVHLIVGCLCSFAGCAGSQQAPPTRATAQNEPEPEMGAQGGGALEESEAERRDRDTREQLEAPEMARAHEADDSAVRRGDVKPINPAFGTEPPPIHPRSMKP
jgi:hypothetical protein